MLPPSALHTVATQTDELRVLQAAVAVCRDVVGDGTAFAALPEGAHMRMAITDGLGDPRFTAIRIAPGAGLGGYVLESGQTTVVGDYSHDPRISREFVDIVSRSEGLQSIVCVPVLAQGRPVGLLYGAKRAIGGIGSRAADGIEEAASYAAIGIQQARERRHALELERLRDRERLATQLHDSVAQMLFGIGVAAQRSLLDGDPTALSEAMREIELTAADARRELRDTLDRLAACDDGLGLEARLHAEVRLFSTQSGCKARVARSGSPRSLPDLAEELIVDVVVEGLRNAVKHAGATFALACLDYEPRRVHLAIQSEVADAGRAVERAAIAGTGRGLAQLCERARAIGGTLALAPGEDGLLTLRLELPTPGAGA